MIDAHIHIFPPDIKKMRDNFLCDSSFNVLYHDPKARIATDTDLIGYLDHAEIESAIAMGFAWQKKDFAKLHNDFMLDAQLKHPGRIYPFGALPLSLVPGEVHSWITDLKKSGFAGIGEIAFYKSGMDEKAKELLQAIFEACEKENMPLCLHVNEPVGHTYTGKYNPDFQCILALLENTNDLKCMLSHWGGGLFLYELMPEVKKILKNCYYDTAASPFLYDSRIYSLGLKITGPGRIIFGSDFPLLSEKRYVSAIKEKITDEEIQHQILHSNCINFLNI